MLVFFFFFFEKTVQRGRHCGILLKYRKIKKIVQSMGMMQSPGSKILQRLHMEITVQSSIFFFSRSFVVVSFV